MTTLNLFLLQQTGGTSQWSGIILIAVLFVLFWLFFIRPQNKKNKEQQQFRESLKKGDKVITIGGLHGIVDEVKERTVILSVDTNAKIEVEKSSIIANPSDIAR
ncbi:MAG TPA: preprotein translocase subunit YajC [Bacteroidetes bacterium]|nr:preprotein translocase subunit YajC [Candidatus Limimorpha avicola]